MRYNVKPKSYGKKNVLMLTTMRPCLGITKDDGKENPALYKFYDFTKGGTDIGDQKLSYYTAKAKSLKWKMVAFYFMLDTARMKLGLTLLSLLSVPNEKFVSRVPTILLAHKKGQLYQEIKLSVKYYHTIRRVGARVDAWGCK